MEEELFHLQALIFDEDCRCTNREDTVKLDAILHFKITLLMQNRKLVKKGFNMRIVVLGMTTINFLASYLWT